MTARNKVFKILEKMCVGLNPTSSPPPRMGSIGGIPDGTCSLAFASCGFPSPVCTSALPHLSNPIYTHIPALQYLRNTLTTCIPALQLLNSSLRLHYSTMTRLKHLHRLQYRHMACSCSQYIHDMHRYQVTSETLFLIDFQRLNVLQTLTTS